MPQYQYLIIGGGMTADAAIAGIREVDPDGSIGVIGAETDAPYNRPPLTKGLWKGDPFEKVWRKTERSGVELHLGTTAESIDPERKSVMDEHGTEHAYSKLLIATGGTPRRLPFGDDHILYFRTLPDYRHLRDLTEKKERFAVIGGGFIGSELAAALSMNGKKVTMIFPDDTINARMVPPDLGRFLNQYYEEKGVVLVSGRTVTGLDESEGGLRLAVQRRSASGPEDEMEGDLEVDAVVAGLGIQPNVELAQGAKIAVENGILVDEFLRTNHPDIYAAGDVAVFYNPALGKRIRVEHEDNANTMGKVAGRNMAGRTEPYHHLPFFYSDLFDLGYEAVGETDSRLEVVADWKEPNREGVLYYLNEGRVRGVILWNVWNQVPAARALIAEPGPFKAEDLKGRLPR